MTGKTRVGMCGFALLACVSAVAAWAQGLPGREKAYVLEPELLTLRLNHEQRLAGSNRIRPGGSFQVRALPKMRFKPGEKVNFTWTFDESRGEFSGVPQFGADGKFELTATKTLIYVNRPDYDITRYPDGIATRGYDVLWESVGVTPERKRLGLNEGVVVGHNWLPVREGGKGPVDEAILQIKVTRAVD